MKEVQKRKGVEGAVEETGVGLAEFVTEECASRLILQGRDVWTDRVALASASSMFQEVRSNSLVESTK
jgi:hypothetical protein